MTVADTSRLKQCSSYFLWSGYNILNNCLTVAIASLTINTYFAYQYDSDTSAHCGANDNPMLNRFFQGYCLPAAAVAGIVFSLFRYLEPKIFTFQQRLAILTQLYPNLEVPADFKSSILHEPIMNQPVFCWQDGQTYDRAELLEWLRTAPARPKLKADQWEQFPAPNCRQARSPLRDDVWLKAPLTEGTGELQDTHTTLLPDHFVIAEIEHFLQQHRTCNLFFYLMSLIYTPTMPLHHRDPFKPECPINNKHAVIDRHGFAYNGNTLTQNRICHAIAARHYHKNPLDHPYNRNEPPTQPHQRANNILSGCYPQG